MAFAKTYVDQCRHRRLFRSYGFFDDSRLTWRPGHNGTEQRFCRVGYTKQCFKNRTKLTPDRVGNGRVRTFRRKHGRRSSRPIDVRRPFLRLRKGRE